LIRSSGAIAGQLDLACGEICGPLAATIGRLGTNLFHIDLDRLARYLAALPS
jgi:hypothetical protein